MRKSKSATAEFCWQRKTKNSEKIRRYRFGCVFFGCGAVAFVDERGFGNLRFPIIAEGNDFVSRVQPHFGFAFGFVGGGFGVEFDGIAVCFQKSRRRVVRCLDGFDAVKGSGAVEVVFAFMEVFAESKRRPAVDGRLCRHSRRNEEKSTASRPKQEIKDETFFRQTVMRIRSF